MRVVIVRVRVIVIFEVRITRTGAWLCAAPRVEQGLGLGFRVTYVTHVAVRSAQSRAGTQSAEGGGMLGRRQQKRKPAPKTPAPSPRLQITIRLLSWRNKPELLARATQTGLNEEVWSGSGWAAVAGERCKLHHKFAQEGRSLAGAAGENWMLLVRDGGRGRCVGGRDRDGRLLRAWGLVSRPCALSALRMRISER